MTEAKLLNEYARRRDPEAFAEIVKRYQSLIFATCRRKLHHSDDIDDAVQETFLRLAQKAGELHSNLGGWLHTCAVHVSIDLNRRRSTRSRHESAVGPAEPAGDSRRELAELREHLDAALEKLNDEQRELIVQRFFVGRSQVDLAAGAGISASAITHRMNRAIGLLREHLQSVGCGVIATAAVPILVRFLEAENAAAAVPASLTSNLMKIGLSGTPPATTATGSLFTGMVLKLLMGFAAAIVVIAGLWLVLGDHSGRGGQKTASGTGVALATTTPTTIQTSTQLVVGDRLRVSIDGLIGPSVITIFTPLVEEGGKVSLPLVPVVNISGKTATEAELAIDKAYQDAFLLKQAHAAVEQVEHAASPRTPRGAIQNDDQLKFTFVNLADPGNSHTIQITVDQAGQLDIPDAVKLKVVGLTESQAAKQISSACRDAHVQIFPVQVVRERAAKK